MPRSLRLVALLAALCLGLIGFTRPSQARGTITLTVDASDAPRKILHARLGIPVEPGALALSYPKWIPGEHGPTGPLTDVAGLKITAGGRTLAWQRDLVDMYMIRSTVPAGTRAVQVEFDFLSAASPEGFSSAASATQQLVLLSWNQALLYPSGEPSNGLTYAASLRLPSGWKFGTALPVERQERDYIQFAPVSLTTLVDSPVLAGANFRTVDLSPGEKPGHFIDMAADSKAALEMPSAQIANYHQLIAESYALFGARHYRQYHFLLSLSDHVAHFGLEHHESSDDRTAERMWLDDDLRINSSNLMPHELVHSWNGKYRRPADLATPDFQQPMKDDLLWVYEGLTQYLGFVLAARSGVRTLQQSKENLALQAAYLDHRPGRTWRPLIDTAVEAQLLYGASDLWQSWRRGVDFYNEGLLLWLDADVIIRKLSQGKRSLDDFCRRFHGGKSGPPQVVTYSLDDVVHTMNEVAPYDWRKFFATRVESVTPHPPLGGIEEGGWRIAYTDSIPAFLKANEQANKYVDLSFSLGLTVNKEDGMIEDAIPGMSAASAGVAPGMKLVAVNGRHWSKDVLHDAVRAGKGSADPIELLVDNGEFYRSCKLDYHGGERYPRLERVAGKADLVGAILKPLRPRVAGAGRGR